MCHLYLTKCNANISLIHVCLKSVITRTHYMWKDACEKHVFIACDPQAKTTIDTRTLPFLKHTLVETKCTLQLYFTENYICHFLEEISSVYYSKYQVNICPAVIHYKGVNGVLETQEPRGAVR